MTTWNYRVPQFAGSRWEAEGFEVQRDYSPPGPTVGLYCAKQGHPDFLIGMFSYMGEADLTEEKAWEFVNLYPTGAGELILLRGLGAEESKWILNDEPMPDMLPSDTDTSSQRVRHKFKCKTKTCRYRRNFTFESTQEPLTRLWEGGAREVSLAGLARCVELARA